MIHSVLRLALALHGAPALADEPVSAAEEETEEEEEDPLAPYRLPLADLVQRTIGTVTKPVAFDWRQTKVQVAATGSQLFELNNFNSIRGGAMARFPSGGMITELGLSYVKTWDTPSSELLALTPYRQPGRPSRLEIDLTLALPLAEGVVTAAPRFLPAAQLVFNAYATFRYSLYTGGFKHMKAGKVLGAIFAPALTDAELDNLERYRLDAMQVDTGRYELLIGLGNDLYFKQGLFISPRAMFSLPLLATVSQSHLLFWADFSLALGVAF